MLTILPYQKKRKLAGFTILRTRLRMTHLFWQLVFGTNICHQVGEKEADENLSHTALSGKNFNQSYESWREKQKRKELQLQHGKENRTKWSLNEW